MHSSYTSVWVVPLVRGAAANMVACYRDVLRAAFANGAIHYPSQLQLQRNVPQDHKLSAHLTFTLALRIEFRIYL